MSADSHLHNRGVRAALGAALLFGAGTPLAKALLGNVSPWLMAGLLYAGSGAGLIFYRAIRRAESVKLPRGELRWLIGAIFFGGVLAPVLLMYGLARMPASGASLLLNAEGVFTALIAWFAFRENFDRRIALGLMSIVAGAVVLSSSTRATFGASSSALSILGACLCWGIDNNLTRRVSLSDATWIAGTKGLSAGLVNLVLAMSIDASLPSLPSLAGALLIGLFSYGASLALFVLALRDLGTARTGAYFSAAPFFGAVVAINFLGEPVTLQLTLAAALMAFGVWLHLTEHHGHEHTHETMEHEHEHAHDEHHQHGHDHDVAPGARHTHRHKHARLTHSHAHFPDAHHRHEH